MSRAARHNPREGHDYSKACREQFPQLPGETRGAWTARAKTLASAGFREGLLRDLADARSLLGDVDFDLARAVVSRAAGQIDAKRRGGDTHLAYTITALAKVALEASAIAGIETSPEVPAIDTSLPDSISGAYTTMDRASVTNRDFRDAWKKASRRGAAAVLPDHLLAISLPPRLWPALVRIVKDGPDLLARRLGDVLYAHGDANAGGAGVCRKTLSVKYVVPAVRLSRVLAELRALKFPHRAVEAWIAEIPAPPVTDFAHKGTGDVAAPPLELVRKVMRSWWRRLEERTNHGQTLPRSVSLMELRIFLMVSLSLNTGSRRGAVEWLRLQDYEENHLFPDHDIPRGPAIRLDVAKRTATDTPRWKAIAPRLAPYMRLYIEAAGLSGQPGYVTLWPTESYSCILGNEAQVPKPGGLYYVMAGSKAHYDKQRERTTLRIRREMEEAGADEAAIDEALDSIVITSGVPLFPRPGGHPWEGYRVHSLRSAGIQHLTIAAEHFLASAEGKRKIGFAAGREALVQSVVDHRIAKGDNHQYGLCAPDEARENNSAWLAPIQWELLTGDLGAPRGIDRRRIAELRAQLADVDAQRDILERKLRQIDEKTDAEISAIYRRSAALDAESMSSTAVLAALLKDLSRARDLEQTARREARVASDEREKFITAREELVHAIKLAEVTEVPLPYLEEEGFDPAIFADPEQDDGLDEAVAGAAEALTPVRDLLWPHEMAYAMFGDADSKSVQKIRAWLRPDSYPKGVRAVVPWTREQLLAGDVLDTSGGQRTRKIRAACINWDRLTACQQKELRALLAQPMPHRTRAS